MTRERGQTADAKNDGRLARWQASAISEGVGEDPSEAGGEIFRACGEIFRGWCAKCFAGWAWRKGLCRNIAGIERDPGPHGDRDQKGVRRLSHWSASRSASNDPVTAVL